MYKLGSGLIGSFTPSAGDIYPTYSRNKWQIQWNYKDGGLKRLLDFNIESYITAITFELNEKICGASSIDMSYIDFPINIDDEIIIRYDGNEVYRGYIETIPDPKGGKVKVQPFHKRYGDLLYTGSFTGKTIKEILKTIIEDKQSQTGIRWSEFFVTIIDATTYTYDYSYEKVNKIIDELIKNLDDTFWGVNADNIFTVYQDETTITRVLDNCVNQEFISVGTDIDYAKIKRTRYQVFRKVADGDSERVGEVGYGSGYDPINLEDVIHTKEDKFNITIPDLTDTECKDFAYADLNAQQAPETTKIKGYDISGGFPEIGKKWRVIDKLDLVNKRIVNCNSLSDDTNLDFSDIGTTGWNSNYGTLSLATDKFVYDGQSVKFVNTSGLDCYFEYDFVNEAIFTRPDKINFSLNCSELTTFTVKLYTLEYFLYIVDSLGNNITDSSGNLLITYSPLEFTINVESPGRWVLYELDLRGNSITGFNKIRFDIGDMSSRSFYVDNFNVFGYYRDTYEGNIKKINIKIDKETINQADLNLNFYDKQLNDEFFATQKRVQILESISQEG